MDTLKQRMETLEIDTGGLRTQLALVSSASDGYMGIRNCFFAVFCRDVLKQRSAIDRQAIGSGNLLSHVGDVLTDCHLFEKRIRHDPDTFRLLYGFSP